ncbi:MAG TPA: oxygenase MpaB family protein [Acidimicrobiales bacterium]|jgi:uncharacterized protein (DUF2236 family)|nr:oxygenase MpaB family protein [Acidimicrobiales bacterium]
MYQPTDATAAPGAAPHPELGPDSLLWRWAGDTRIAFMAGTIGLLQTMHPAIGQALIDHSDFFDDPADRVFRSLPEILGTVYDAPDAPTGRSVRDAHRDIKGVHPSGESYHALQPDTFWWAHATFQFMVEQVIDRFDRHQLTNGERDRLYAEGVAWYRRYGVSERPVPPNRAAFQEVWDHYCAEVLQPNPASDWLIATILADRIPKVRIPLPNLPAWTMPVVNTRTTRKLLQPGVRITGFGGLPPIVRERFDIPWTRADQVELRALETAIARGWPLVPWHLRWQPRAKAGWRREGVGRRGSTSPLRRRSAA